MLKDTTASRSRKALPLGKAIRPLALLLGMLCPGIFLSSCLKTNAHYTDFFDIHPIAELFMGGPAVNVAYIASQSTPTDYTIDVNLASPNAAAQPLTMTLAIDTADFNRMNDSVGDIYTLIPDSVYKVPSWKVTVPKGEHQASLHILVNSSMLDNQHLFVLPLKITDASGTTISGNYGNGYWLIAQGNAYVGLYGSTGYKLDVGVITNIHEDKYLYYADTTGGLYPPNTVIARAGDDVTYIDYGIAMDLTIDPVSDTVAVTSDPNQGAGSKTALFNNGTCIYDPGSKTFTLNYAYVNAYGNTDSLHEVLVWKPLPQ